MSPKPNTRTRSPARPHRSTICQLASLCALAMPLMGMVPPGIVWQSQRSEPEKMALHAVAANPATGLLVAVGSGGVIRCSDDNGVSWALSESQTASDLHAVTWTGTRWIAVGGGYPKTCEILVSENGRDWDRICLAQTEPLGGIASGPQGAVAVGQRGQIAHSQDLLRWTTLHSGAQPLHAVIRTGDRFLAGSDGGIIHSSADGGTWTAHALGIDGSILAFASNGPITIAGGYDPWLGKPLLLVSDNQGASWAQRPMTPLPDSWIRSMTWTGSRFVGLTSGGLVITSTDGNTWEHHSIPALKSPNALCWNGQRLVAVGDGGGVATSSKAAPSASSDWTMRVLAASPSFLRGIAECEIGGMPRLIAVGHGGTILHSGNGAESFLEETSGTHADLLGVTATGWPARRLIAVGESGIILSSPDGENWTPETSGTTASLHAVAWRLGSGLPLAIAVGDAGKILTSNDGGTWLAATSGTTLALRGIASGWVESKPPGMATLKFVAVGDNGTILTSSTGIGWTPVSSGSSASLLGIAHNGVRFVAVGLYGEVLSSPNGTTWTRRESGCFEPLSAIAWTGSQFIATGFGGTLLTSPDGTTWTRRHGPTQQALHAATALSSGRLVAAGSGGVVMTSDPQPGFPEWLASHAVPPGADGPEDDPNGDGVPNLLAYGFGIPPMAATTAEDLAALPAVVETQAGRKIMLRLSPHQGELGDLVYLIEESNSLSPGTWTEIARREPGQDGALGPVSVMQFAGSRFANLEFPERCGAHARYFIRLRMEWLPQVLDVAEGNSHAPNHELRRNIDAEDPSRGSNRPQSGFSFSASTPPPSSPATPSNPGPQGALRRPLEKRFPSTGDPVATEEKMRAANQDDVADIKSSERLRLDVNSVLPDKRELNDGLKASTKGMDPAVKAKLRKALEQSRASRKGNQTPEEAAREAAARARQRAAQRLGGPEFRDAGDEVKLVSGDVLDSAGRAGIVPSNEPMAGIPSDPERAGEDPGSAGRRAALAVRAASQDVLPQWTTPKGSGTPGDVSDRSIEAQIAAAVKGRKPLYYEPWGDEELSDQLAASYRNVLSEAVNIRSRNGTIYIYRDEAVSPILDGDPAFYRPNGEDDFEAIVRVSESSENGELLGYGARSIMERPGHEVRIFKGKRLLLYYFVSSPDRAKAMKFANDRSVDFIRAFGWDDVRYELARVE